VQVGKKVIRSHNGLLRTFAGADGMKTGFICDSGFNVVASATRDGRRLVAVVLGEPSVAMRSDRAANLLENGFKRYFWKSVFGTTVDGLAVQASLSSEPAHLRDDVCGPGRLKRQNRRTARSRSRAKLQGIDASSQLASQPN
jgi:D-alanyl-D-alanine carboxypeptidase